MSSLSGKFSFLLFIQNRAWQVYWCVSNFRDCQKPNTPWITETYGWNRRLETEYLQQVLSCCLLLIVTKRTLFKNKHGDSADYQILHTSYQNFRILDSSLVLLLDCGLNDRGIQGRYQARIKESLLQSAQTNPATHPPPTQWKLWSIIAG